MVGAMILGCLDDFRGREARGWARPADGEEPQTVEFIIDGEMAGRARANQYREDLVKVGICEGLAGFSFSIPDRFCDGLPHDVDVHLVGSSEPLARSPLVFTFGREIKEKQLWCERVLALNVVDRSAFEASIGKTRKLAIFATYHRHCAHLDYHRRIVASLTKSGFTVLIVHATDDPAGRLSLIEVEDCFTLIRRNIGYDFGSYATGLMMFSDMLPSLDELILLNDSVVLVADDLYPVLQRFRLADADVVSCTDSFEIQHHLQSYFVWFGAAAIASGALISFMTNYSFTSVKGNVIEEGEIGLSSAMRASGLRLRSLYDYATVAARWLDDYEQNVRYILDLPGGIVEGGKSIFKAKNLELLDHISYNILSGIPTNPSHFFWDTLIDYFDFPFLKRELIIANPCAVPTYSKIASYLLNDEVRAAVFEMTQVYGGSLVTAMIARGQDERATIHRREQDSNLFANESTATAEVMIAPRHATTFFGRS